MASPLYNSGLYNRSITLLFPVRTRNSIGAVIEAFAAFVPNVWAQWTPGSGSEYFAADDKISDTVGVFRIRWRSDIIITAAWRVLWEGRLYELTTIPNEAGHRQGIDLIVKQLVRDTSLVITASHAFQVLLDEGDESKEITFPVPYDRAPTAVYVQLIIPPGGYTFNTDVEGEITATGFTVALGAAVPGPGYKLTIMSAL